MTEPAIPGFRTERVPGVDGVELHVAVGGAGPPVVLLHGFPQTHLCWRDVAVDLARDHLVVCPDLRGYGASDKPAARDAATYAKRTMAADVVAVARRLGADRFALAGHDRGALVAIRAGLDHPDAISHLALLDALPLPDTWDILHGVDAAVAFHLYLMAQPPGLPETLIAGAPDAFFGFFLDAWGRRPFPDAVRAAYLRASREAVDPIVADYRASAGIDLEQDRADHAAGRRLTMPTTVVAQDWGAALGFDAVARWRPWAADLEHVTLDRGHFMAEEAPDEVVAILRALLAR